jgi:hypothetical protein
MGLAYADRLIRLNRGTLQIDSQPGQETTVTIIFPCEGAAKIAQSAHFGAKSAKKYVVSTTIRARTAPCIVQDEQGTGGREPVVGLRFGPLKGSSGSAVATRAKAPYAKQAVRQGQGSGWLRVRSPTLGAWTKFCASLLACRCLIKPSAEKLCPIITLPQPAPGRKRAFSAFRREISHFSNGPASIIDFYRGS